MDKQQIHRYLLELGILFLYHKLGEDYNTPEIHTKYISRSMEQLSYVQKYLNEGLNEWQSLLQRCGIVVSKGELMVSLAIKEIVQMEYFDDVEESFIDLLTELEILLKLNQQDFSFNRRTFIRGLMPKINSILSHFNIMFFGEPIRYYEIYHNQKEINNGVDEIRRNKPPIASNHALEKAGQLMVDLGLAKDVRSGIIYFVLFMLMKDCAKKKILERVLCNITSGGMREKIKEDLLDSEVDLRVWAMLLADAVNKK